MTLHQDPSQPYMDAVPGSLLLVDESIHHGDGHASDKDDIILSPVPSYDVNDPLNWSNLRKAKTLFATVTYIFTCGFCCSTVFSGFQQITDETGIPYSTLTEGTGYLYGAYGWGGPLIMPFALKFGHRPVYLITILVVFAMTIWVPWITTSSQWITSRVIYGLFGSPCESLNEVTISMIYFSHERGYYLGFYSIALYFGAFLAPACSGYLFNRAGLAGVSYFTAGVAALGFFIIFFLFEEVSYNRPAELERVGRAVTMDEKGRTRSNSPQKDDLADVAVTPAAEPLRQGQDRNLVGTPHGYLYSLGFGREVYCTNRQMFDAMWRPLYCIYKFPSVFYAGFSLGLSLIVYTLFTGTIGTVLNAAPYNFDSGKTGLVYLGPLVIACFAGPVTGLIGDRMVIRSARRHDGVREPEARLWINTFNAFIVPPAFILWGVGATFHINFAGLEIALIGIGAFVVVQAAVSCAYLLDCYKEMALEVMVGAVVVRNTMSFAFGYAVAPMITNLGIQNANLAMGFAGFGFILTFLIVIWKGKQWRAQSKDAYWKMVATCPISH
ncbi:MFS transporter [Leucosporidium creatinivorum]|uniref:MFS transporter n=1 Tax=Leucosporidium creatinivorum TaxID=106004 RepID=A0A1Y2FVH6_9BASI|nr:MFS transporter [Leucosporidium creatinivorum]